MAQKNKAPIRLLVILLALAMILCSACGQKPEPDPDKNNDVSTSTSLDENSQVDPDDSTDDTNESSDVTDESTDSTDESSDVSDESSDTSDASNDTTPQSDTSSTKDKDKSTTKSSVKSTTKSSVKTNSKSTTKSSTKSTTKSSTKSSTKTSTKSTTKSTNKTSNNILIDKTTSTTASTTSTTIKPADASVKEKILSMFDPSMEGKTVKFLIHYVASSETEKLKQMYEETGVKIKFTIAEYDTFGTRLSALINAKSSPDVAYFNSEQYAPLVNKGFMTDLSAYDVDLSSSVFDQELMDIFTWNGKKYGISTKNSADAVFTILYYNKTKFDRVGYTDPGTLWKQGNWNWDTFVACAQAVNDPTNGVWGCELYDSSVYLCSGGIGIITMGDGEIINNLSDQRIVNAWTFINKLHHEYKVTSGLAGAESNFSTGKSAMLVGETWMWGLSNPISQTKDEWGVVPAPLSPDVKPSAIINPRGICVPIGSKNPKAGLAAYTYWTSKDTYEEGEHPDLDREMYPHLDSIALNAFYSDLWSMPKIADLSTGIIEYGGEYSRWDFSFDVFMAGMSGIKSNMDKWKNAIDISIRRIMTEFS